VTTSSIIDNTRSGSDPDFDAIVVGAGFSGLYSLHKLRDDLGLKVAVFEAGGDVGGTWYWNQYPGARCDIESIHYSYSFSHELQQEWEWSEKYASQPEILRYLNHVADRFDLRPDITFNTRVDAAVWDEVAGRWNVTTDAGVTVIASYFISASGNLSVPRDPEFDGIESFGGEVYTTGRWPHKGVDLRGKKVAVIGTGSSGVQVISSIAEEVEHLTVFQRTPVWATPSGNAPSDPERTASIKATYAELRNASRNTPGGVKFEREPLPSALEVSPEERRRVFEDRWPLGGFHIWATSFSDIMIDKAANDTLSDYIRERIRERIQDPDVAKKLLPNYPYASRRPAVESTYYDTFNRSNVSLVDVAESPIVSLTPGGLRTTDAEFEFDVVILATGFDAMTGPALRMGIVGRDSMPLLEKWADGPRTYLGLQVNGFPNFFLITGPQSPSVLYNMPLAIEDHVDFIADAITYMRENGLGTIEPTAEAEAGWGEQTNAIAEQTLLPGTDSWWMSANVPGKPRACMLFLAGANVYRQICADVVAGGYHGFSFESAKAGLRSQLL
jgi:cation diffusion facilitator CzcD-associated flavoprotein CzcO